jgi:hypothetical protein
VAGASQEKFMIENRSCGDCDVCCVVPALDEPGLTKPPGVPCKNLCPSGCAIYESRPKPCRAFLCAWRLMPELDESWRPDRVGLLGILDNGVLGFLLVRGVLTKPVLTELRRLCSRVTVRLGISTDTKFVAQQIELNNLTRREWRGLHRLRSVPLISPQQQEDL